ncbi:hypothetical protein [Leptothermofonsia sp. ETS-13]|uniref:hypothetical protein n=1 Tax=Leptothermofonsia sp. ETS-13 TaxID=3035696 RepID=UPI003BA162C9
MQCYSRDRLMPGKPAPNGLNLICNDIVRMGCLMVNESPQQDGKDTQPDAANSCYYTGLF